MCTPKTVAKRLNSEHEKLGLSWREMARSYGIPHRTLRLIAKSSGNYWPRKWEVRLAEIFGAKRGTTSARKKNYSKLADMPINLLAWKLLKREVMQ
jgi:hypothetical protein